MTWAQSLRRVFDIDISRCTRCGAALRVLVDRRRELAPDRRRRV